MLWAAGPAGPAAGNKPPSMMMMWVVGGRDLVYEALEEHTNLATPWALAKVVALYLHARVCVGRVRVAGG
jgi:hypothetical protein